MPTESPITIVDHTGKPYRPEKRPPKRPSDAEQVAALRARLDAARRKGRGAESRFDAAQTTDENRNHWAAADGLSANAANSADVRYRLRTRSRYERANNGYCKGLIRARTNDTVGTGPRLQLDLPERFVDPDFEQTLTTGTESLTAADLARAVEKKWKEWVDATHFCDKIRVLADAEDTDGEGFALFTTDPDLDGVTLDLRVIEADRVTTPGVWENATQVDGVRLDAAGRPVEYHVLRYHPGDTGTGFGGNQQFDRVPARLVIHLFDQERPEQVRGLPLLTSALPLYAVMRRYTLAALHSAEWAACVAGVIEDENGLPGDGESEADEPEEMDTVPIARNSLLYLGGGRKAHAFDSKQPAPGYGEFKTEILTEAGRGAGENQNTSTGSSAIYNYSSGRLDHLPRRTGIRIRRERYERRMLDRVFRAWLAEALLIPGYLPAGLPPLPEWEWKWHWDAFESIDPVKDATAQEIRKSTGLTTDADELAAVGKDWREHYRQLARERQMRIELGIDTPQPVPSPAAQQARLNLPEPEEARRA